MTDHTGPLRIPLAHSVSYVVRSLPDVPYQYGRGVLRPSEITLTYRTAPDSQLGRVHAYIAGRLWVDGAEIQHGAYGQHYDSGLDNWPAWLTEEARLHDPDAAVSSAPSDRVAELEQEVRRLGLMVDEYGAGASALTGKLKQLRDIGHRLAAHAVGFQDVLDESDRGPWARTVGADIAELCEVLDAPAAAVLPASVDRAAEWRAAADHIEAMRGYPSLMVPEEAVDELRRVADETPQPETEAHPPHHRWYVETRDGLADEWAPGQRFTDRADAVERYQNVSEHHPLWKDGTPVRRRFVRETTSYTVEPASEQPAVGAQQPKEA